MTEEITFNVLQGKILKNIEVKREVEDEIFFTTNKDITYKMYHSQSCCESVTIEDINGDLSDLLNTPILQAEESSNQENPKNPKDEYCTESFNWTFYRISTIKGSVIIRWYGTSNGYYSESVDFEQITQE